MQVILEGNLIGLFKKPDYKDKTSGEVTEGKHTLQILVDTKLSNGSIKQEMQDVTIPNEKVPEYESQKGKKVQVRCNYMSKTNVSFFVTH